MGQSPKSKYYSNNTGFPFIQGNRTFGFKYPFIDTYTSKITKKAKKGDVLISVRAPVGDLNMADQDICIGRGIASLHAKDNDNNFLFYALKANLNIVLNNGNGTTYSSITTDVLKDIQINIPDDAEIRTNISKILKSIDDQIERNNTMVKRLQVLSQSIFNRFFAQENQLISLLEFPYIQIIKPGIIKFDDQKHYIATADVEGEYLNFDAPSIGYDTRESRANMQPIKNSIWFAKMKNSIKHIYLTKKDELLVNNYVFSTGFCGIKCDDIAFEYLINYINLPYFEIEKDILAHGATQESTNNEDLRSFKIHLPSKEKLRAFHNKACGIHCRISEINLVTYQLSCLKEKLLPLLINGQLQ